MAKEYAEGLSGAQYQQAQLDANARAERQPISVWDEENPDPGPAPAPEVQQTGNSILDSQGLQRWCVDYFQYRSFQGICCFV